MLNDKKTKSASYSGTENNFISTMLINQFEMVDHPGNGCVVDIVSDDAFVMGYVYGFVEQASRHFNADHFGKAGQDYMQTVITSVVENPRTAETLFSFARQDHRTEKFSLGYRTASRDLGSWLKSRGEKTPTSLADHLNTSRRAA